MSKIVVVGSCNIDITVECDRWVHPGETIFGNRLTISPGGKGANQAVAAARLGADVMMVGCIGDDVYGQLVLKALKENNVDSTYVKVLPGENSGTAHITVAETITRLSLSRLPIDLVSPSLIDEAWRISARQTWCSCSTKSLPLPMPMSLKNAQRTVYLCC